ncbi:MAG: hypothetical protein RLZZ15_430 [Verrucomicrobiota bacterium]|jgi:hypothetical protein
MTRPRSAQELIHWLEIGGGARWLRRAAVVAGVAVLSLLVAWKQFRGPGSEATLEQAAIGRQLARGEGFTTLVNHPQTAAFLEHRGVRFDAARPFPSLHHAPLYPLVVAGGLRALPAGWREKLFAAPAAPLDGFGADFFLLGLNVAVLWLAAWLTYLLGARLFDPRTGWVAAGALLLSASIWQQTVAVTGTPLLMVLALAAFLVWRRVELAADRGAPLAWLGALGAMAALLFLAEYSAGALLAVALAYAGWRFAGAARWLALAALLAGFAVVAGPWLARNVALAGHPVALAAHHVALKAGDPTAEPATLRATLSADAPSVDLNKLANKALTSLQENLQSRLWSGGAMWFAALFAAGWLYAFRSPVANRLRWLFTAALAVLLVSQAVFNSGETERHVAGWLAPLMLVFGAGFFWVLLGANAPLAAWPRAAAVALLALQAVPLAHDALEPARLPFRYPPYWPPLFANLRDQLAQRGAADRFGLMADVPAGVAWYGGVRAWAQPPRLRDFYAITITQPIGGLLLTPRTLDRPFFSALNARPLQRAGPNAVRSRFGEWGEIYAGLLTGALPTAFPLGAARKIDENLYVLLNPALPPVRGN